MSRAFPKPEQKQCSCCRHAIRSDHSDTVLCPKKGFMKQTDGCRSFRYDPLGRKPSALPTLEQHTKEEFEI